MDISILADLPLRSGANQCTVFWFGGGWIPGVVSSPSLRFHDLDDCHRGQSLNARRKRVYGGGVIACIHTILSETELKGSNETQHLKANMSVWAYWAEHSSRQSYCDVCRRDTLHADHPAVRAAFKAEPVSVWSPKSCILMWFSVSSPCAVVKVFSSFCANF